MLPDIRRVSAGSWLLVFSTPIGGSLRPVQELQHFGCIQTCSPMRRGMIPGWGLQDPILVSASSNGRGETAVGGEPAALDIEHSILARDGPDQGQTRPPESPSFLPRTQESLGVCPQCCSEVDAKRDTQKVCAIFSAEREERRPRRPHGAQCVTRRLPYRATRR